MEGAKSSEGIEEQIALEWVKYKVQFPEVAKTIQLRVDGGELKKREFYEEKLRELKEAGILIPHLAKYKGEDEGKRIQNFLYAMTFAYTEYQLQNPLI